MRRTPPEDRGNVHGLFYPHGRVKYPKMPAKSKTWTMSEDRDIAMLLSRGKRRDRVSDHPAATCHTQQKALRMTDHRHMTDEEKRQAVMAELIDIKKAVLEADRNLEEAEHTHMDAVITAAGRLYNAERVLDELDAADNE
jgi:hypothetical protein